MINIILQIFLIGCIVGFNVIILSLLKKKHLNLKYSLVWLLSAFFMLAIVVCPQIIFFVGALIGIETPVNTVFLFAGVFTILIVLTLTVIVSNFNNKLYRLAQTIALLEKRIRELEKK
jgi:hypothetical protein